MLIAASVPPMYFTDRRSTFASMQPTLQIFSVKVEEIMGGLRWPIDVYGMVAVRDVVDHNRNILFHCQRDDSQTLTEEVCTFSPTLFSLITSSVYV